MGILNSDWSEKTITIHNLHEPITLDAIQIQKFGYLRTPGVKRQMFYFVEFLR